MNEDIKPDSVTLTNDFRPTSVQRPAIIDSSLPETDLDDENE